MFTWIHKNDWFKKKATFVRSGKVEMISTFQRNRHFRKVLVNKTFTHVQEQKSDVVATFRLHAATCKIAFTLPMASRPWWLCILHLILIWFIFYSRMTYLQSACIVKNFIFQKAVSFSMKHIVMYHSAMSFPTFPTTIIHKTNGSFRVN